MTNLGSLAETCTTFRDMRRRQARAAVLRRQGDTAATCPQMYLEDLSQMLYLKSIHLEAGDAGNGTLETTNLAALSSLSALCNLNLLL